MAISLTNIRSILLAGLRRSPEQREKDNREAVNALARRGAEEMARYNALSDQERQEYDDLTYGMMPHLRGAREYWRRRWGGSRTGGRYD
jgi:hypothetical protein